MLENGKDVGGGSVTVDLRAFTTVGSESVAGDNVPFLVEV
jgi:hypothetical protein